MANLTLRQYWYDALHTPPGIYLRTTDLPNLKSQLYRARQEAADPELAHLIIRTSPSSPTTEVWIIHGPREGADTSA